MKEVIMFIESEKERKTYECPNMPEAPRGSIFHKDFDISTLKMRRNDNIIEFINPEDNETAITAIVERHGNKINASFVVTELAIRSFQVFKNIEISISVNSDVKEFK